MEQERKICVGKITGAHGLRGLVRLRSFTDDPQNIAAYPVTDAGGVSRRVTLRTAMGGEFIAEVEGVTKREEAEAVRGVELFVARDKLPELVDQREYYLADLIGLRVDDKGGVVRGVVSAVHDFGAGAIIEVKFPDGQTAMLPFRDAFVPRVALREGFIVIDPPEDWLSAPARKERPA